MSHLDSARMPAAIVFAALLVLIMVSASRMTYRLSPAPAGATGGYVLASCASTPVGLPPRQTEPAHACPWPHQARSAWAGSEPNDGPDSPAAE